MNPYKTSTYSTNKWNKNDRRAFEDYWFEFEFDWYDFLIEMFLFLFFNIFIYTTLVEFNRIYFNRFGSNEAEWHDDDDRVMIDEVWAWAYICSL